MTKILIVTASEVNEAWVLVELDEKNVTTFIVGEMRFYKTETNSRENKKIPETSALTVETRRDADTSL